MLTLLTIAFRNLFQAKRRTLLLGIAVSLVAMLFVVLRSVSYSISDRMIEAATTLSAGHVNVSGFYKSRKKASDPIVTDRQKLRELVKKAVPEATAIIDRHRGWGRIIGPASSINAGLSGIIYAEEGLFFESLRLAPESEYLEHGSQETRGNFADLQDPHTVLLFSAQAKKLGVNVGDMITVVTEASGGQSNTVDLRVAAIASDMGMMSNWNIFVSRQTILELYRLDADTTGAIMVYLPSPDQSSAVMERLQNTLKAEGYEILEHDPQPFWFKFEKIAGEDWLGQRLDLTLWSDEISFVMWITTALDLVAFMIIGILSLIIGGGIMNAMWMSVRERVKEIGTMRAIGTSRGFVVGLFLGEGLMLGFFSALVGGTLACLFLVFINSLELPITSDGVRLFLMANTLAFKLHPMQIFSTLGLFSFITACASIYPAFKAARLRPVEALMQSK